GVGIQVLVEVLGGEAVYSETREEGGREVAAGILVGREGSRAHQQENQGRRADAPLAHGHPPGPGTLSEERERKWVHFETASERMSRGPRWKSGPCVVSPIEGRLPPGARGPIFAA